MTLLLALLGCGVYTCDLEAEPWFTADSGQFFDDEGCELDVQAEGDVIAEDGSASVEFSVRIEGDGCDPGGVHEVGMEEYDDGGGLTNGGEDSWDVVRTGEERRYTLSCEVSDDGQPGECGCVVNAVGESQTIKIVLE